jgi:hypothetical protein
MREGENVNMSGICPSACGNQGKPFQGSQPRYHPHASWAHRIAAASLSTLPQCVTARHTVSSTGASEQKSVFHNFVMIFCLNSSRLRFKAARMCWLQNPLRFRFVLWTDTSIHRVIRSWDRRVTQRLALRRPFGVTYLETITDPNKQLTRLPDRDGQILLGKCVSPFLTSGLPQTVQLHLTKPAARSVVSCVVCHLCNMFIECLKLARANHRLLSPSSGPRKVVQFLTHCLIQSY